MYFPIIKTIVWCALELTLVAWAVFVWRKLTREPLNQRSVRSSLAIASSLLATIGLVYQLYMFVHAQFTGGYAFYSRPVLAYIRFGLWLSVTGILLAAFSKGSPRVHAISMNFVMLMFVVMEAEAQ